MIIVFFFKDFCSFNWLISIIIIILLFTLFFHILPLTEMFYMVGLIRPPKNHRSWIPSCGSSVGHIWKAWSRFFGFRAKKRAETAKTADFGPKSSFLAQKWLDVLNPFWSSEMHQIWSICMILPKKLAYEAKLDIFGLFIY